MANGPASLVITRRVRADDHATQKPAGGQRVPGEVKPPAGRSVHAPAHQESRNRFQWGSDVMDYRRRIGNGKEARERGSKAFAIHAGFFYPVRCEAGQVVPLAGAFVMAAVDLTRTPRWTPTNRSAGFPTCCVADFPVGRARQSWRRNRSVGAGLETRDTAGLEACATTVWPVAFIPVSELRFNLETAVALTAKYPNYTKGRPKNDFPAWRPPSCVECNGPVPVRLVVSCHFACFVFEMLLLGLTEFMCGVTRYYCIATAMMERVTN